MKRITKVLWETPLILQRVIMISLAIVLTILVCVEVAVRYFAHVPILWVEDLALYIVFWFYLTAAVYATYRRRHIVGGIVHILFKDKARVTICFDIFQIEDTAS